MPPEQAYEKLLEHGDALERMGRYEEAVAYYARAIDVAPNGALAYAGRGIVQAKVGRQEQAIADLQNAIELEPNLLLAHLSLGYVRVRRGVEQPSFPFGFEAFANADSLQELGEATGHYPFITGREFITALQEAAEEQLPPWLEEEYRTRLAWLNQITDGVSVIAGAGERAIRVFVSSTFRDMQAERDVLIKEIFPQLRKLCEARAVTWTEVDLRWGVTDEEAAEGQVLSLCLAEIERCRPYFICLLGERYGWVPEAVPPDLLDSQPWLAVHRDHSVTALEILHGVLRNPSMADRALFYFRDPIYLDRLPPGTDRGNFTSESSASATKLEILKDRVRAAHAAGHFQMPPRENYADPAALGAHVLADVTALINAQFPQVGVPNPLDQEAARHEAYARSRRLAFVGRDTLLRDLDAHVESSGASPLVLTGESGCGKSALLAEWVARWRAAHADDLVVEHYIGSTPESADWQGLVRRVLGELHRAFGIAEAIPLDAAALRGAIGEWLTRAAGSRRIVLVLDALNQLGGDDAGAQELGWLPVVVPRNVCLVVSTLPGDSLEAVRQRGWRELPVSLFGLPEIAPAAVAYLAVFGKKLPAEILTAAASTSAACNPLFLRTVLDELRQFGDHRRLTERATWYLGAPDLQTLFDRVLARWDDDFGEDPAHPDLVRRSLCFLACARYGLAEAELLDVLGTGGVPMPQRPWAPFYLAAERALALRAGLLTFGHEYLRAAVHARWFAQSDTITEFREQLADYFTAIPEPTDRKLDELPDLLCQTGKWAQLKDLLAHLPTFSRFRASERWKWELHGLWLALGDQYDSVEVYRAALVAAETDFPPEQYAYEIDAVATFHWDAGRYAEARSLYGRALAVRESVLGAEHLDTLASASNLSILLDLVGDYEGAKSLCHRAMAGREKALGAEHPDTLASVNNLAHLLNSEGEYRGAEELYRRLLAVKERVLGPNHPVTLLGVSNLARTLANTGDDAEAESLCRRAVTARETALGVEHPSTLTSATLLGKLLREKGDYAGAVQLCRRTLAAREHVLGPEHPQTLVGVSELALTLVDTASYEEAESLYRRALAGSERLLGADHSGTYVARNNLGHLLLRLGDYAGAEPLLRDALAGCEQRLGAEHSTTLTIMGNLASLLEGRGDYAEAEQLERHVLAAQERTLGKDHPSTLGSANALGVMLARVGEYAEAIRLCRHALVATERALGPDHRSTLVFLSNLAFVLERKGDLAEAEQFCRRSLALKERLNGTAHPETLTSLNNLAFLLARKGDFAEAKALYERALAGRKRVVGVEHPDTLSTMGNLALLQGRMKDYPAAKRLFRRTVETQERVLGTEHADTLVNVSELANLLESTEDYSEAESLYRRALHGLAAISRAIGREHPRQRTVFDSYVRCLQKMGYDDAEAQARTQGILEDPVLEAKPQGGD